MKFTHWFVRGIAVAIAAASVSVGARVTDAREPATAEACQFQCGSGSGVGCPDNEHKVWESTSDRDAGMPAPHSECIIRTCSDQHPCESVEGAPAALADSVGAAVLSNGSGALVELTERYKSVVLHRERSAFLVLSCSGDVFAAVPAPAALIESVHASLSTE